MFDCVTDIVYTILHKMSTRSSTTDAGTTKTGTRRAPAPGEASSRTESTERDYTKRALWFESHTARNLGVETVTPTEVAAYALERREEWAKSTWRQTKAALLFHYAGLGSSEALQAVEALRDGHQSICATKTGRTSAKRSKTVSAKSLEAVIAGVRGATSKYASLLETWLLLGAEIGLRPHEWGQASLILASPTELGDVEAVSAAEANELVDPEAQLPYLRIRNAKTTNGRSHGDFRHMNLSRLRPGLVEMVGEFATLMTEVVESGHYPLYYSGCRKLLYRVNKQLHGNSRRKWVQLYSPRHRFSSEAKHSLDAGGVAALMGHGTTKTASEHYGRRVSGSGSLGPRPVAAEVIRVRKIRGHKARQVAAPIPSVTVPGG